MIAPPAGVRILVAAQPVDFRKGIDGLAAVVQGALTMTNASRQAGDSRYSQSRSADRRS